MQKHFLYLGAIVTFGLILSGCWHKNEQTSAPAVQQEVVETRELVPPEIQADADLSVMSELNDSDDLDSIQKELDQTQILEEDFSDL